MRTGARQLIYEAVEAELEEVMSQFKDRQLENGRAAVIRNGYQPERQLQTSIGPVTVKIPKNPIESTFATIRHRTKRSKGCLSRNGMLHMMFKLGECAEKNWHRLRGFIQLPKVVTGVNFKDGIEQTESNQTLAL